MNKSVSDHMNQMSEPSKASQRKMKMRATNYKTTMRSGLVRWSGSKREAVSIARGEHADGWPSTVTHSPTGKVVASFNGQPARRRNGGAR